MAIDLGSSNTSRYHKVPDHADFNLPNTGEAALSSNDWAWVALVYPQSTADIKYLISTGAYGAVNSLNLWVYNTASGSGVGLKVDNGYAEVGTSTPVTHDKWNWIYGTRRSGNLYVGQAPVGGAAVEATGPVIFTPHDSTTGPYIGSRSDLTANRFFKGRWGQIAFMSGAGITAAQAAELANGSPLLGMPFAPNIKFLLHGRTANDATISDLIGGKVATRNGTSYGTAEEDIQTPYIWTPDYIRGTGTSSGVTGTVVYTNLDDISSASGTTTVTGSSTTTNANDTSAATGSPVIVGTSATTNADDTSSASGSVGSAVVGSVAYTNIDDVSAASGTATVVGTAAAANVNDTSSASGTTTVTGTVAYTNADDVSAASGEVETVDIVGTVAYTNADDVSAASGTTTIVGSVAATNNNDTSSAQGVINNGIVVEPALTTGIATTVSIKKPGIPVGTPDWLKTTMEIVTGRRGNKITVPEFQTLTFSATPTQAECEALYSYVNQVRTAVADILTRLDS